MTLGAWLSFLKWPTGHELLEQGGGVSDPCYVYP